MSYNLSSPADVSRFIRKIIVLPDFLKKACSGPDPETFNWKPTGLETPKWCLKAACADLYKLPDMFADMYIAVGLIAEANGSDYEHWEYVEDENREYVFSLRLKR